MSFYESLGVDISASHAEIKRAYKKALRTSHPDTGGSPEAFRRVQEAWAVLGDASRRRAYDASTKVTTFTSATAAPTDYRERWNQGYNDGSKKAKAAFWDSYDDDKVNFYKEQNERFATASQRARDFSDGDYEAMEPQEPLFIEAMRAMWLKFVFLIVTVLSFAAILITASTPSYLLTILVSVAIFDAVVVVASIFLAVFLVARSRHSSDDPIYLISLLGVVFSMASGGFVVFLTVTNAVSEISLIAATLATR